MGDKGVLETETGIVQVSDTKKLPDGKFIHFGEVVEGTVSTGQKVRAFVDIVHRQDVARNHTTTHLLHKALHEVLGDHAVQKGSLVAPDRLRFDFSHADPMTPEEIDTVEEIILDKIASGLPVETVITDYEKAVDMGAMALFGEKYDQKVRVLRIGDYSMELCGGTHLRNTSEALAFDIVSEGGIGSGLRRIEAVTGKAALTRLRTKERLLEAVSEVLKTPPDKTVDRVDSLIHELKHKERELESLRAKVAKYESEDILSGASEVDGIKFLAVQVEAADADVLRSTGDILRDKMGSGVVVLGAVIGGKANFVAMATKDAVSKGIHAGKLVGDVARIAGGGGGGRPDMAQAGGKDPSKIQASLGAVEGLIKKQLGDK